MDPALLTFIAIAAGLFLSMLGALIKTRVLGRHKASLSEQQITHLTSSLRDATRLIERIEGDIKERHIFASKLQQEVETYSNLAKLKQPEIEAVANLVRGELHKERRRSFWENAALGFFFFLLGVVSTVALSQW